MASDSSLAHTYKLPKAAQGKGDPSSAGQSGDTQGLRDTAEAGDQSIEELVEEGQSFEAGVLMGVEDAAKQLEHEVQTQEVPEDDVPPEYQDAAEPPRSEKN